MRLWEFCICARTCGSKGFDVDVFDTTFSSREALFRHLRSEKPSVLGIYANLMTRKNVIEILQGGARGGMEDNRRRSRAGCVCS